MINQTVLKACNVTTIELIAELQIAYNENGSK